MERLQALQPEKAAVVEMRFFGGLTDDEIASVLGVTQGEPTGTRGSSTSPTCSAPALRQRSIICTTWP